MSPRAVVFAYHDVGDRCLRTLVSGGWEVPLVITHRPDLNEKPWFADVGMTAQEYDIAVARPDLPSEPSVLRMLDEARPDFVFSFYYRHLLPDGILRSARRAALNMHGSLLPRFRGRAPVNWAILSGMHETGVTLHHMTSRADAGDIVDQQAVPILMDDDARMVMAKITFAAELVLARNLPSIALGTASRRPQNPQEGEYRGRRKPEDGRIDWSQSALAIHNLVRAVAPPFPGAFTSIGGVRWTIHRTRLTSQRLPTAGTAFLFAMDGRCFAACCDDRVIEILKIAKGDVPADVMELAALARERVLLHPQARN